MPSGINNYKAIRILNILTKEKEMFFSVIMIAVLLLSGCESPVQENTKKEPEKIVEHDMWDYYSGTWKLMTPVYCIKERTVTFDKAAKTMISDSINTCAKPGRDTRLISTWGFKFYRKGNIEIGTRIQREPTRNFYVHTIVQKQGRNRMTWSFLKSRTDPPDSLELTAGGGSPTIYQRQP